MQTAVNTAEGRAEDTPPPVHVCPPANRRLNSTQSFHNVSRQSPGDEPSEAPPLSSEEQVLDVTHPSPAPAPAQLPRRRLEMAESAQEELQRAAAILLKHDAAVFEVLCSQCRPLLHQLLSKLALFDDPDDAVDHAAVEDDFVNLSAGENEAQNHSEAEVETPSTDIRSNDADTASESLVKLESQPEPVSGMWTVDVTASSGEILENGRHQRETVGSQEKPRLWSEEQSSGSEVDEELRIPAEGQELGESAPSKRPTVAAPDAADVRVSKTAVDSPSISDKSRTLTFHSRSGISNFAWANVTLPSPKQVVDDEEESSVSSTTTELPSLKYGGQLESQSSAAKRTRPEQEALRMQAVVRKKDFRCIERIRGRLVNVVEGLELHEKVFNKVEMQKLIDMVYKFQEMGRNGLLRERTYSEPRKWMPGKGRVTIQFGCCYNYAQDRNGNPPGIMHEEIVDDMPDLLKTTIRRLIRWGVLPETCVPDSCIINIYDVGDCIPPHIDHHDFVRPFSTLSLLSECSILFGSKLSIVGEGKFDGPISIPLPVGSVLVLKGNGADVAKHAVPGVPTKRISITFRKMDPSKVPRGYELPKDLKGIRTAPHLR